MFCVCIDPLQMPAAAAIQSPATPARARKQRVIPTRPREVIWSGELEWIEKEKADQPNVVRQLPCNITSNIENGEPEM